MKVLMMWTTTTQVVLAKTIAIAMPMVACSHGVMVMRIMAAGAMAMAMAPPVVVVMVVGLVVADASRLSSPSHERITAVMLIPSLPRQS